MSKMDDFKQYLRKNPALKAEVLANKRSWQEVYETWVLTSDLDDIPIQKEEIKEKEAEVKDDKKDEGVEDMLKTMLGYAKKINPDNVTKYVTSIQKVLELLASFGAGATTASIKKNTTDPLFDRKFDEWY